MGLMAGREISEAEIQRIERAAGARNSGESRPEGTYAATVPAMTLTTRVPYAETVEAGIEQARKRLSELVEHPDEWEVQSVDFKRWKPRAVLAYGVKGPVVFTRKADRPGPPPSVESLLDGEDLEIMEIDSRE